MTSAATFRAALGVHVRRRRMAAALEGAKRGGWRSFLVAAGLLLLAAAGVLPRPGGLAGTLLGYLAILAAGTALGVALALRRAGGEAAAARALDGALGEGDLAATALALVDRPAPGRFGESVLARAGDAVAGLPPERVGSLPRPPWTLLALAALVALLLGLLPEFGLGILPGFGAGQGAGGPPRNDGVTFGPSREKEGGEKHQEETGKTTDLERLQGDAPKDKAGRKTTLSLSPPSQEVDPLSDVSLDAEVEGDPGRDLDLVLDVDDGPPRRQQPLHVGNSGRERRRLELGRLPAGRHRVKGRLLDGEGRTVAESGTVEIEVKTPEKGDGGSPPPPAPGPGPQTPPPPPPAIPESKLGKKFVDPQIGGGAEVEKKGPLLVLDPEGNRGDPPREMPPEEALREVKASAETAARREGVDPRDAETVRRYFEALRRLLEGKK